VRAARPGNAVARLDRATDVQQREVGAAAPQRLAAHLTTAAARVDSALDGRRTAARLDQTVLDLVGVRDRVDQARVARFGGDERPAPEQITQRARLELAAAGHRIGELAVQIIDQRLQHLAVRRREVAPGEHLARRLVASHLHDIGLDAELLQGIEYEDRLRREPGDVERGSGSERDALGCRRQVVLVDAGALEVHPDFLARGAQAFDRAAQPLQARPVRVEVVAADEDPAQAGIVARPAQQGDDAQVVRGLPAQQTENALLAAVFSQVAAKLDGEHTIRLAAA
jgi:hypothetical protein